MVFIGVKYVFFEVYPMAVCTAQQLITYSPKQGIAYYYSYQGNIYLSHIKAFLTSSSSEGQEEDTEYYVNLD